MNCRTDPADLVLACYGDLASTRRRELEAHLQTCETCAGERRLLGRILDAVTPAAVFPREAEVDWSRPLTCQAVRADLASVALAALDGKAGPAVDHWRYAFEAVQTSEANAKREIGLVAIRRQRNRLDEMRMEQSIGADAFLILQEELDFQEVALASEDERPLEES